MELFKIANNDMICLHGRKIPKNAVYGAVSPTQIYICEDFKIRYDSSRKEWYYNALLYAVNETRSLYREHSTKGYQWNYHFKYGTVANSGKNTILAEQVYLSEKWKPCRIYEKSKLGRLIAHHVFENNPEIVPVSNTKHKKNNDIVFRNSRPKFDKKQCKIPSAIQSGKCLSKVHAGLYDSSGHLKKHIIEKQKKG